MYRCHYFSCFQFLFISISLFFVAAPITSIRCEKILPDRDAIYLTGRVQSEPPGESLRSSTILFFLPIFSRLLGELPWYEKSKARALRIESLLFPQRIYTLRVTNYADNNRSAEKGEHSRYERPSRALFTFRAVFIFFDTPPRIPQSLPFPEYTLMSVITLGMEYGYYIF